MFVYVCVNFSLWGVRQEEPKTDEEIFAVATADR